MTPQELQLLKEAAELNKTLLEDSEQRLKNAGDRSDQLERSLKVEQEELKILKIRAQLGDDVENAVRAQNEQIEKQIKLISQIRDVEKETEGIVTSIAAKFGLVETNASKFLKKILDAEDPSKAFAASMAKALNTVKNLANPLNAAVLLVGAMAVKTAEVVLEVDRVRAGFVGITADASDAMRMAERLTLSNLDLAISFDQMSRAQVSLRTEFAQFGFLSDSVRESVTLQAAQLEKLGVDAGTTASIMNTLTMSLGQSASQAAETQREIIGLGQALKIPPGVIARDFAQALPHLAQFGDKAVQVFENLAVAARESGLSVSELTDVFGDQFNTIEGSVSRAAKLNQIMRTDTFSGMQLLYASTDERQRIIREGLELNGMQFEDLGRLERINVAAAIGFRDVAQAQAFLGRTQEEVAMRIGDTSFSIAEMEEMTQKATATMDKMKFIFMELAVLVTPLVDAFGSLVQGMLNLTSAGVSGTRTRQVGDTSVRGGATILSGNEALRTSPSDQVVAAQEGGILVRELREIKSAISNMGSGGGIGANSRIVLEVPGLTGPLETKIKDVMDDTIHGFA